MNKLVLASLTGIAVLAIAAPALAYQGNPDIQGPNYTPARHEAMERVFATKDYQGWLKLMEGKAWRLKEVVNSQEKFVAFSQAHESGVEAMAQFRTENNLGAHRGSGYGRNR